MRIILAKLLIKQKAFDDAEAQLRAVIEAERPHYPYAWERRFRPEAERILDRMRTHLGRDGSDAGRAPGERGARR